ncbi:MAG: bacteriophage receptor, outer rane subunit [Bacteroidota bacterium]|jgi:tetratricopeptide (TPR) repeat protein|nr:bacteriophage receptor, outer rane subunit [Bacteroidota bacterium]
MARKQTKTAQVSSAGTKGLSFSFESFNFRAILLIIVGFIFYANTFTNEYALDDGIVIEKNDYVQQGFRGIPKILSTDAYESYYRQMNAAQQLSGGRYRPLSIVTFAIEQQLFGSKEKTKSPTELSGLRHVLNVLFYILSIVALFYFLLFFVFKANPDAAFLAALIFLIHPMHTEVVANVKSRDEILSFLFVMLTFISVFKYKETNRKRNLIVGLLFYFLALLSKEYAITLVVLIPMLFYILRRDTFVKSIISAAPFFIVAFLYLLIRFKIVGKGATTENTDVLNNPYMFATPTEKWATKIEVLNHYLRLLFYPHPLSSDYSFSTIAYTNFGSPLVWFSILFHLGLIISTVVLFFRRHILAFAFAFYLLHLALVCNLFFDVGATMGERLVYHSSLGFAISIALIISWLIRKTGEAQKQKLAFITVCILLAVPAAIVAIPRNADWKNDNTLFIHDAEVVPNSALVNGNAGKAYVDLSELPENKAREKELLNKAIYHLNRAVSIHKNYVNGYLNLGVCYFKLKDYDKSKAYWDKVKTIFPNNPYLKRNFPLLGTAYMNEALTIGGKDPQKAIALLEKAVICDPSNPDLWYNLGGASFTVQNYTRAREAWMQTLLLKPDYEQAKQGLAAIQGK